jgi:hypothetical protein
MTPIEFRCQATLPLSAEEIAGQILDLAEWVKFRGYGPVPGIRAAVFEDFSPPLSRLATEFEETWEFTRAGNETHAIRSIRIHPKSHLARFVLWLISYFLRRAISRHLRDLQTPSHQFQSRSQIRKISRQAALPESHLCKERAKPNPSDPFAHLRDWIIHTQITSLAEIAKQERLHQTHLLPHDRFCFDPCKSAQSVASPGNCSGARAT